MPDEIEELMWRMNPWWETGTVPHAITGVLREKYLKKMEAYASAGHVLIISGVRRSGKTTLMYQYISRLLKRTEKTRVLYLQLDHPEMSGRTIGELVRIFRDMHSIPNDERVYLFLDEATYSPQWTRWVKALYDMKSAHIVVSGSSSSLLNAGSMTELTGRHLTLPVYPLSFPEFLDFRGKVKKGERHLYRGLFEQYLRTGGFPEAVLEKSDIIRRKILSEYFDDIIYRDIVSVHRIRDPSSLRKTALLLLHSIGRPTSINKIKNILGISISTVREYVSMLESSYLFLSVPYFSASVNERTYNPKKYYAIDTGLVDSVTGGAPIGSLAENAAALHLLRTGGEVSYWKDRYEVDFIVDDTAVECKYREDVNPRGLKGMERALRGEKAKNGLVLSGETKEKKIELEGYSVDVLPIWDFLMKREGV